MTRTFGHQVAGDVVERLQELRLLQPSSPKRRANQDAGGEWYPYYAGYADEFVAEVVRALPDDSGTLLDPWNGSGTTTSVATIQGIESRGYDLNPAAVMIAKGRLLHSDVRESLGSLTEEIIGTAVSAVEGLDGDDLLRTWFEDESAAFLRGVERRIYQLLVDPENDQRTLDMTRLSGVSALAAAFYLGLFRSIRPVLGVFRGSNPTWVKRRVRREERLRIPDADLAAAFKSQMEWLSSALDVRTRGTAVEDLATVEAASSTELPIDDASVNAVITSPPYCTRIDYVVATLPELAIMGLRSPELKPLRDQMIGTPTLVEDDDDDDDSLGPSAAALLREISNHRSKASDTYYRRFFGQYLRTLHASIGEIARVARPSSPIVLVAQDSYYKEVHVDLPALLAEMGAQAGWTQLNLHEFAVPPARNYAAINAHSQSYRDQTRATESVLIFSA